ncbi:uncharacterized protein LOC110859596 [Folsomia candida]|uniref:uncharacterized protein LOC110859596 n=1 Tax=Folsomia candida TaxID=158441 RepID=UPI000B8F4761|nr:uncharacterized protein LOC110859596 [Folsomia candida]
MTTKKLKQRLRNISLRDNGTEAGLVDDLFGVDNNNFDDRSHATGQKKKRKVKIDDIPEPVLAKIFEFLKEPDLKSLRSVSKLISRPATQIFRNIHTPIIISSEMKIFAFKEDLDRSSDFPFTRFKLILQPIPRHMLISFTSRYEEYIKYLSIETPSEGCQRLVWKLTGVIQELMDIEELEIMFPSFSSFDYTNLQFENDFDLASLKILSISFASNGFCPFSSDLTLSILEHAEDLEKLRVKLPEPKDKLVETVELRRVLEAAAGIPKISLILKIDTNNNVLLGTISQAMESQGNTNIRSVTFLLGKWVTEYQEIAKLLRSGEGMLIGVQIFRRVKMGEKFCSGSSGILRLPGMSKLKFLEVDSYRIPIRKIEKGQFPELISLSLHMRFGNEEFYWGSVLHPVERLKLQFHETSIMAVEIPEVYLDNLVSSQLKRLELVNPPPGQLSFMSGWGGSIETLIISSPKDDPTYSEEKVLYQLRGVTERKRERGFSNRQSGLLKLHRLRKLHLFIPIDEAMADYLCDLDPLYELVVDDSKICRESIQRLRSNHNIYISRPGCDSLE